MSSAAVFLDRDGVLVRDDGIMTEFTGVQLLDGVPQALSALRERDFELIVVSNQPVVARGLASEADIAAVNESVGEMIASAGGPSIAAFYFCPHHPHGDVAAYRSDCDCRKPKPGLLRRAAEEHGIDLTRSFMVGDRITDIIAGASAGCRTVLVETGRHTEPPIVTSVAIDGSIVPDFVCGGLPTAAAWILSQ